MVKLNQMDQITLNFALVDPAKRYFALPFRNASRRVNWGEEEPEHGFVDGPFRFQSLDERRRGIEPRHFTRVGTRRAKPH